MLFRLPLPYQPQPSKAAVAEANKDHHEKGNKLNHVKLGTSITTLSVQVMLHQRGLLLVIACLRPWPSCNENYSWSLSPVLGTEEIS